MYEWINDHIVKLRIKVECGYLTILQVYSPEKGGIKDTHDFYDKLQESLNHIYSNDKILLAGSLNVQVGVDLHSMLWDIWGAGVKFK